MISRACGAAVASDGVIHLAFKHDVAFSGDFQGAADADRRAVETLGEALAGSDRPFLIASGTLGVAPGRLATERDGHGPDLAAAAAAGGPQTRRATAELALSLASRSVRSSIVRLPPTNHGDGDNGFIAALVAIARERGVSGYIGDGTNRWPAVHRLDSARLFRLALEGPPRDQRCTPSPRRACRSARSPRSSAPPRAAGRLDPARGRGRALRLARRLPRGRRPGLERADPRAAGLAANQPGAHRRPRPGALFPGGASGRRLSGSSESRLSAHNEDTQVGPVERSTSRPARRVGGTERARDPGKSPFAGASTGATGVKSSVRHRIEVRARHGVRAAS